MSWWAVYARGGRALGAREELRRRGLSVFCPVERTKHRRKTRNRNHYTFEWRTTLVFGRYMFAEGAEYEVRSTPWVESLISFGGEALKVPERVITAMRALTSYDEEHGDVMSERDLTALRTGFAGRVGDHFRFTDGPFSGYLGVISSIEKLDSSGVIGAHVSLFGRDCSTEVARKMIRPLTKAEAKSLLAA